MTEPNLTPRPFLNQMHKQAVIRRWIAPVVVCSLAAVVPIFLELSKPADTAGQIARDRVTQAEARKQGSQSQITSKAKQLAQLERELKAGQHLTSSPDWGAVISLVSKQFDESLMLAGIELDDVQNSRVRSALGSLAADVPDDSAWMIISGFAETNRDVPGLIMRLESLGLFERVVMTGTQRETFAGGSRTRFTLACRVE